MARALPDPGRRSNRDATAVAATVVATVAVASRDFAAHLRRRAADRRDVGFVRAGAALEYGRARDQHIGAGAHDLCGIVRRHPAIDLDVDRPPRGHGPQPGDLFDRAGDEFL